MRILFICFVYNERRYLPTAIEYYKNNGCDCYVIDNMSDDGTWEWLQENNIKSSRLDTDCSFDLRLLQAEIVRVLAIENPDWVIYGAADLYYVFYDKRIDESIHRIDSLGFNMIASNCYSGRNTGERHGYPLVKYYHYCDFWKPINMIAKYDCSYSMNGDDVKVDNSRIWQSNNHICINYGACKPEKEQLVKLKRRKKAWKNGLSQKKGRHYSRGERYGWVTDKKLCLDIRTNHILRVNIKHINKSI